MGTPEGCAHASCAAAACVCVWGSPLSSGLVDILGFGSLRSSFCLFWKLLVLFGANFGPHEVMELPGGALGFPQGIMAFRVDSELFARSYHDFAHRFRNFHMESSWLFTQIPEILPGATSTFHTSKTPEGGGDRRSSKTRVSSPTGFNVIF